MSSRSSIVIVNNCDFFLEQTRKDLGKSGFNNVSAVKESKRLTASLTAGNAKPDLLLIDIHLGVCDGFDVINCIRAAGYQGLIAAVSSMYSLDVVSRAVLCGADDYLIINKSTLLPLEISKLLSLCRNSKKKFSSLTQLTDSGFLRGIGLTRFERKLLDAFYPHFPSQKELAMDLGRSEGYIRKLFSNLYRKFHVLNYAQLAGMLTVCSRFLSMTDSIEKKMEGRRYSASKPAAHHPY